MNGKPNSFYGFGALQTLKMPFADKRQTSDLYFKGDSPRKIAQRIIKDQVAQRPLTAVLVDRHHIFYFQKKTHGRLCDCTLNERLASYLSCPLCYGTGRVGGYEKFGTITSVMDLTIPSCQQNLMLNWSERPKNFILDTLAKEGWIWWRIKIMPNIGQVDICKLITKHNEGQAKLYVNGSDNPDWPALLKEPYLDFMVKLERKKTNYLSPMLWGVFFRYKVARTEFLCDVPKDELNISLQDLGIYDFRQERSFFLTSELPMVSTQDFMFEKEIEKSFKIIKLTKEAPLGILHSWRVSSRCCQSFEPFSMFPIGS